MADRTACHECQGLCQEGLLFCETCAPRDSYVQGVTVFPPSATNTRSGDGSEPAPRHRLDVRSKSSVRREAGERPAIRVTRDLNIWNHDRQRYEDATYYFNRDTDVYREIWTMPGTNEVTWEKTQRLSEHGRPG